MLRRMRRCIATAVAAALVALPTSGTAKDPVSTLDPTVQHAVAAANTSPWLTLSALTGSSSSATTAAAAARGEGASAVPPPAPLAVILGTIALGVWIILRDDNDWNPVSPVSP